MTYSLAICNVSPTRSCWTPAPALFWPCSRSRSSCSWSCECRTSRHLGHIDRGVSVALLNSPDTDRLAPAPITVPAPANGSGSSTRIRRSVVFGPGFGAPNVKPAVGNCTFPERVPASRVESVTISATNRRETPATR